MKDYLSFHRKGHTSYKTTCLICNAAQVLYDGNGMTVIHYGNVYTNICDMIETCLAYV